MRRDDIATQRMLGRSAVSTGSSRTATDRRWPERNATRRLTDVEPDERGDGQPTDDG
jgi:hypothetical protein